MEKGLAFNSSFRITLIRNEEILVNRGEKQGAGSQRPLPGPGGDDGTL
jgi:hypothetical protein